MSSATIKIRNHEIKYNKDATRWLGIWMDSALKFREHKEIYIQKAKKFEARQRSLVAKRGLAPGLVRRVQIAAVQSIAIYGAELWWHDQNSWCSDVQKLINRQGRSITGMFGTTPIGVVVKEADLNPAKTMLNKRQRKYAERLLKIPKNNPVHHILPVSFRKGDRTPQPGEIQESDMNWTQTRCIKTLGQRLANNLVRGTNIDSSVGMEPTEFVPPSIFPGTLTVLGSREEASEMALQYRQTPSELSF